MGLRLVSEKDKDCKEKMDMNLLNAIFNWADIENLKYVVVRIEREGLEKGDIVITQREDFDSKLEYYRANFNEDLTLKTCDKVRIVEITGTSSFSFIKDCLGLKY